MNANIKGVHAPLIKLGQVEEEYSTALEIAVAAECQISLLMMNM